MYVVSTSRDDGLIMFDRKIVCLYCGQGPVHFLYWLPWPHTDNQLQITNQSRMSDWIMYQKFSGKRRHKWCLLDGILTWYNLRIREQNAELCFFFSICFNVIAAGVLTTYVRVNAWMNASWFEHDGITMNNNNFYLHKKRPPKKTNNKNLHIVPTFYISVVIRKRTVLLSRVGLLDPCHYSSFLFHPKRVGGRPNTWVTKLEEFTRWKRTTGNTLPCATVRCGSHLCLRLHNLP